MKGLDLILVVLLISSACHVNGTTLKATFSMSGIRGTVTFTQSSPNTLTDIKLALTGVNETLSWQIHDLPVIYKGNAATTCNTVALGNLYDPDGTATAQCSAAQKKSCAVGDLRGKFGLIDGNNMTSVFHDSNLPLTGRHGIFGRTLVLKTSDVFKACAIITSEVTPTTALATFKKPVAGTVYFRQTSEVNGTLVYTNLFFVDTSTSLKSFYWKIMANPIPDDDSKERCANTGEVYDPKTSANPGCSSSSPASCAIGDLSGKLGSINITSATSGLSSTQEAFTDVFLPLTGSDSIIGHLLVLYNQANEAVACADILKILPRKAKAKFQDSANDGVSGSFMFSQVSPFDPTHVAINIRNLRSEAEGYHIHEYPNPSYKGITGTEACSLKNAGDHLNPYGIVPANSPANGTGTDDQYEIGDLSGKFGSFLNRNNYVGNYSDYNLPLFGRYSPIGRSVVIHKLIKDGNKRWVCSNIELDMPDTYKLETNSNYTEPEVIGHILMTQYRSTQANAAPLDTAIYLDLKLKDGAKTTDHNWHVHEKPVGDDMTKPVDDGRCSSLGPHYNPYNVDVEGNYKATCSGSNPLRCELGDLSAKHERYNMGSGPRFYTDIDSPLLGFENVVGRGLIVHVKGGTLPRLGCADIVPDKRLYTELSLEFYESSPFSTKDFTIRLGAVLNVPSWRITYVRKTMGKAAKCSKVVFGVVGGGDEIAQKLNDIIIKSPDVLENYKPSNLCGSPSGSAVTQINSTLIAVTMAIILLFWQC
ncbi:uncharacterized protein LOC116604439 [Nematostella vectensis]|uniref:uncharacterized protein LOC116604439 n=1 Tax=Nematostella vectensis TaxID=45351 RepID=UPI0020774351|nr:uncharacterized protein LOC116604439 [Nematostella vectensis]